MWTYYVVYSVHACKYGSMSCVECGLVCGVWSRVWSVDSCVECGLVCGVWSRVWGVVLCVECGLVCGVWTRVWSVDSCVECGLVCGVWSRVWGVVLCVECGLVCGVWSRVWSVDSCVECGLVCGLVSLSFVRSLLKDVGSTAIPLICCVRGSLVGGEGGCGVVERGGGLSRLELTIVIARNHRHSYEHSSSLETVRF